VLEIVSGWWLACKTSIDIGT